MAGSERLLQFLEIFSGDRLLQPWLSGCGVVVVLHRVAPAGEAVLDPDTKIPAGVLDQALGLVRLLGYVPVHMDELPDRMRQPRRERFVAFTFDDGYRDNVTAALPIFRAHQIPLCVYVTTGLVDRSASYWWGMLARLIEARDEIDFRPLGFAGKTDTSSWSRKQLAFARAESWVHKDLEPRSAELSEWCQSLGINGRAALDADVLTWDEVRSLAKDPLVTIGAHGVTHNRLSHLTEESARSEIAGAKSRLESEIGSSIQHFAYPYGGRTACGTREFDIVRDAGYATAVTARRGALFPEHATALMSLPRQRLIGNPARARTNRRTFLGTDWLSRRGPIIVTD